MKGLLAKTSRQFICCNFLLLSEFPALDTSFLRNKTVIEGNLVTLQCVPLGNKDKVNVTWIKKSEGSSPLLMSVNFTMNATRFDSGEYYCILSNGVDSVKSLTVYVDVLYKYGIIPKFWAWGSKRSLKKI